MRITPLDVRKQEFRRVVRGADPDEVHAFLATVADEYEAVLTDNKHLREKVIEFDQKLGEYRNMERTLRDTLLTAERVMNEARQNARKEAELILRDAQMKASQATSNIEQRVDGLRGQLRELRAQRDALLARMQSLAEAQIGLVGSFRKDFATDDDRSERLMRDPERRPASSTPPAAPMPQHPGSASQDPHHAEPRSGAHAPVSGATSPYVGNPGHDDRHQGPSWDAGPASSSVTPAPSSHPSDHWRSYQLGQVAPAPIAAPVPAHPASHQYDEDPIDPQTLLDGDDVSYGPAGSDDEVNGAVDQVLAIHDLALEDTGDGEDLFESGPVPTVSESSGQWTRPVPPYSSPEPTGSVRMQAEAAGAHGAPEYAEHDAPAQPEAADGGETRNEETSRWSLSRFTRGLAGL